MKSVCDWCDAEHDDCEPFHGCMVCKVDRERWHESIEFIRHAKTKALYRRLDREYAAKRGFYAESKVNCMTEVQHA